LEVERNMGFKAFIGGRLAVWKKNPWMTIDTPKGYIAKKDYFWSGLPSWAEHPERRPAGVKAINDIFTYVRKQFNGIAVGYAVIAIGEVMKFVDTYRSRGDVDAKIAEVKRLMVLPAAKMPLAKLIEKRKAASARVPAYERLAAELRV